MRTIEELLEDIFGPCNCRSIWKDGELQIDPNCALCNYGDAVEAELNRLLAVIKTYADPHNWHGYQRGRKDIWTNSPDGGLLARECLEGTTEKPPEGK